jgi:Chibby family protein
VGGGAGSAKLKAENTRLADENRLLKFKVELLLDMVRVHCACQFCYPVSAHAVVTFLLFVGYTMQSLHRQPLVRYCRKATCINGGFCLY